MSRLPVSALSLAVCLLLGNCRRQEETPTVKKGELPEEKITAVEPAAPVALPAVPEGHARLELELLRAPMPFVANAILECSDDHAGDAALRERLLASGATKVMECAVTGPHGDNLKDRKLKITKEYPLFVYASLREQHAYDEKKGKPLSKIEEEDDGGTHAEGYSLEASLDECEGGTFTRVGFEWSGPPVIRPVNSWPLKNYETRIIQDRVWTLSTRRTLVSGERCLLAVAPEPPLADGNNTGFVFLAFGTVTTAPPEPTPYRDADPRTLQCWTLEMPADAARCWLAARTGPAGDDALCRTLLREGVRTGAASLFNVMMLRTDRATVISGHTDSVESRLSWDEPMGFEPSHTQFLPFIPNPNDTHARSVAQRLEVEGSAAELHLPADGVKWARWHGATRGALDEPAGVESSATGSSVCDFFRRTPGRFFLANAHTCGPKVRLTIARAFYPAKEEQASSEYTIQILETPPVPWLPRLVAGVELESLIPELTASLTNGGAAMLHTEICNTGEFTRWRREDTWPWMAIARDYINPHIHSGKLRFNPRAMDDSTPACTMEAEIGTNFHGTFSGEPVSRRFGFWLKDVPGYSAETSVFSLTEWPQFGMMSSAVLPADRTLLLHVSLGRSRAHPEQPALHWVLFRSTEFHGDLFDIEHRLGSVPPAASFTITDPQGTVLTHATLPASGASVSDGRMIQSLEPRQNARGPDFAEPAAPAAPDDFDAMNGQISISSILDGVELKISDGQWTLEHSLAPARKITETLLVHTEPPSGSDDTKEKVPVSCERLVLRREKLTGTLPAPGGSAVQALDGGRTLTVRVR
jgi:hypothetical protein